jgi:ubiquitin thioesterase protein OTUB1
LRLGDRNRIIAEETRLKSLNNLLNSLGFQEHLYEDFVETTLDLLRQISASIPVQDDGAALLAAFNEPEISNGIITHFRVGRNLPEAVPASSTALRKTLYALTQPSIDHVL